MVNGLATVEQEAPSLMMSVPQQQKAALTNAASLAADVAEIVRKNGLSKRFGSSPKEHVFVEGWLTISRVNNEAPHAKIEEVQKLEDGTELIKARAWITDAHGAMVSEADGYCSDSEPNWKNKPFYARASMAQTRAIGKAMRLRHAWVMVMAGFSPTPAEEMDGVMDPAPAKVTKAKPAKRDGDDAEKVPTVVVDASEPAEPGSDAEVSRLDGCFRTGVLKAVAKTGSKKDGSQWTRTGIEMRDEQGAAFWANTFSTTDGAIAKKCLDNGLDAWVKVQKNGEYWDLLFIEAVEG